MIMHLHGLDKSFQFPLSPRELYDQCEVYYNQLLTDGLKDMQIGGLILKIERIGNGIAHIPSPHIKPEATAPA